MGLLVIAHYRTTPDDLRYILDGPNLKVWLLRNQSEVIGAILLAEEGGYDARLAELIWRGKRRPRGSLLPQSLAAHLGVRHGPRLQAVRIVRIAVHPLAQRHGLGSLMLAQLIQEVEKKYDLIGASFGANAELLSFWSRLQFQAVRVGVKRDASSGLHSILLLRALRSQQESLVHSLGQRFIEHLPLLLTEYLSELGSELVLTLLQQSGPSAGLELNAQDMNDVEAYISAYRQYETVVVALWKYCLQMAKAGHTGLLNLQQRQLLVHKVLQKKTWHQCVLTSKLVGRKQAENRLREIFDLLWRQKENPDNGVLIHNSTETAG